MPAGRRPRPRGRLRRDGSRRKCLPRTSGRGRRAEAQVRRWAARARVPARLPAVEPRAAARGRLGRGPLAVATAPVPAGLAAAAGWEGRSARAAASVRSAAAARRAGPRAARALDVGSARSAVATPREGPPAPVVAAAPAPERQRVALARVARLIPAVRLAAARGPVPEERASAAELERPAEVPRARASVAARVSAAEPAWRPAAPLPAAVPRARVPAAAARERAAFPYAAVLRARSPAAAAPRPCRAPPARSACAPPPARCAGRRRRCAASPPALPPRRGRS